MNMLCVKCKIEMGKTLGRYQYRECGLDNIWLENRPLYVCQSCDSRVPLMPDADLAATRIADQLVRQEARLDGDSILFLRKAMRLKASELALILGVHRVEVSRWENDRVAIDAIYDFRVRLEAIDRILPVNVRHEARDEVTLIFHRA